MKEFLAHFLSPQNSEDIPPYAVTRTPEDEELTIFRSNQNPIVLRSTGFECAGSGAILARDLADIFYGPDISTQHGIFLSAYILRLTKKYVTGVGGRSDILRLTSNGEMKMRRQELVGDISKPSQSNVCWLGGFHKPCKRGKGPNRRWQNNFRPARSRDHLLDPQNVPVTLHTITREARSTWQAPNHSRAKREDQTSVITHSVALVDQFLTPRLLTICLFEKKME